MTKYILLGAIFCILLCSCGYKGNKDLSESSQQKSQNKYFRPAGQLNYEYCPGVILPLRNGKILALGGSQCKDGRPQRFFQAEDGKRYGYAQGMTELFDPDSGKTTVLTKMPFTFYDPSPPIKRQMQAVELDDGRIFLVGRFLENRVDPKDERYFLPCPEGQRYTYLPFYSKTSPQKQLRSLAPCTENHMFGLIYDWHKHTFETLNAPDDIPPRSMVTLHKLPNGKILIIGGSIGEMASDTNYSWQEFPETRVLCFDPERKKLDVVGHIAHARYGHETIPLSANRFMLLGGMGISPAEVKEDINAGSKYWHYFRTKEVEVFDLKKEQSKVVGHILNGRNDFSAMLFPNNTVLILGGPLNHVIGYSTGELYDMKSGSTSSVGEKQSNKHAQNMPPEISRSIFLFGSGKWYRSLFVEPFVLIAGTDQMYMYNWKDFSDPEALRKHHTPIKPLIPRMDHHLIKAANGRIFIIGGQTYKNYDGHTIRDPQAACLIEEFITPISSNY